MLNAADFEFKSEEKQKASWSLTPARKAALEEIWARKRGRPMFVDNPRRDSQTGVLGVSPKRGKFVAQIRYKKKQYDLGMFDDIEQASRAYKLARKQIEAGTFESEMESLKALRTVKKLHSRPKRKVRMSLPPVRFVFGRGK